MAVPIVERKLTDSKLPFINQTRSESHESGLSAIPPGSKVALTVVPAGR